MFYNDFEPATLGHSHEFIKGRGRKDFLPAAMPMPANALVAVPDALDGAGKLQDRRHNPKVFEPHELIAAGTATIPDFAAQMFQTLVVELNVRAEIGTTDAMKGMVKLLRVPQDSVELCVCEFQAGHDLEPDHPELGFLEINRLEYNCACRTSVPAIFRRLQPTTDHGMSSALPPRKSAGLRFPFKEMRLCFSVYF
ncbi:MAG: hypothetical protein EPO07_04320 [Verrucomicrobia bacterium]|nr:MAG: hypothetical protein EPO07_04320 [Verrucomicrobiota bacterium]